MRLALAACATLALGACASTDAERPVAPVEAARANVRLGVAYMQQGNLQLAKEKLETAEHYDPRSAEVHTALAFLYQRLNQPEKADEHYRTALRIEPQSAVIGNNYGQYLCQNGKTDEALRRFEAAAKDPLYATPWAASTNAGVCLVSAKRFDEAQKSFERALQQKPNDAEATLQLAQLHLDQGRAPQAMRQVETFLSMGRGTPEVLLVGVRAARADGKDAQAESYARRLRRDFPNSPQARALSAP